MNDEDHDGHTINLGPPAGSPADERPKWDPREEDDWYPPHAPPTPVDGDSGRRGKAQIMATALHDAGVNTTVSASDNGLLIRVHDRYTPRLLELLVPPPVGEERRPVDGGERSQSEQWFVVHHNQIRSLRFGTFPIERLARASIAACTCGPHTLRHTVTTTYTASTTEEFVAAATDRGDRA